MDGQEKLCIVCESKEMRRVMKTALMVAKVDSGVLLTGESGTGKEVVSRFIHQNSPRRDKPFVKIDCGVIPDPLFESELFGYEEGAFTGANHKGKSGLIELANGGTLFLDEIGELSPLSQSKLLRVIQDREFLRVGSNKTTRVDIRVISATNRDLGAMVEKNLFREDLFYRINVIPIGIPPLRERKSDILPFIAGAIATIEKKYGLTRKFNPDCIEALVSYEWKGNVRELKNLVEQLCIVADKEVVGVEDLPAHIRQAANPRSFQGPKTGSLGDMLDEYEKHILTGMVEAGGTPMTISRELKTDVTTIRRKLQKHGIRHAKMHKDA